MSLSSVYARGARPQQSSRNIADMVFGPQFQTQPGDPDFSPSRVAGRTVQYPAAAAEQRQFEVQRYAQNRLIEGQQFGFDTSQGQYDQLNEAAEKGFLERALTLGESIIGWIDGPRQAINLMIQDLVGGEAEIGKRDPNIGDYFNAFFSGIDDSEGFEIATGLNPVSGSTTLDMFGWEVPEDGWARFGRGVSHFIFDLAIDPLTYVTFGLSGLGKKVAAQTGKQFMDDTARWILPRFKAGTLADDIAQLPADHYFRRIGSNLDDIIDSFKTKIDDLAEANGGVLPADALESVNRQLTEEAYEAGIVELAIKQRVGEEVLKPLVGRDFAKIPEAAKALLPKYAHGGARISVPFTRGRLHRLVDESGEFLGTARKSGTLQAGWVIPGSVGAGRKITNPLRKASAALRGTSNKYSGLADVLEKAKTSLDVDEAMLRALKEGTIEPWQYSIVTAYTDSTANLAVREQVAGQMNKHFRDIQGLVEGTEFTSADVLSAIYDDIEKANPDNALMDAFRSVFGLGEDAVTPTGVTENTAIAGKIREVARDMSEIFESHLEVLETLHPGIRAEAFEGRAPHLLSSDGGHIISQLADKGGMGRSDTPGGQLLAILMDGVGAGGRLETDIGSSRSVRGMTDAVGQNVAARTILDDGLVLLDDESLKNISAAQRVLTGRDIGEEAIESARLPVTELNQMLEPEVRALAEARGVSLRSWDGKIFNENPLEITLGFVDDMQRAIHGLALVDRLKGVGLAVEHSAGLDAQDILTSMHRRIVRLGEKALPEGHEAMPRAGQTTAPRDFLEDLMEVGFRGDDPTRAARFAKLEEGGDLVTREAFVSDIAKRGVKKPVVVEIAQDGTGMIADGHHRLHAAKIAGIDEVPVMYRRVEKASFRTESGAIHNMRRMLKDELPEVGDTVTGDKMFKINPWQPTAVDDVIPRLPAPPKGTISGDVARKMKIAGLGFEGREYRESQRLYDMIRNIDEQGFLDLRGPQSNAVQSTHIWDNSLDKLPRKGRPNSWQGLDDGTFVYFGKNGKPQQLIYRNAIEGAKDPIGLVWGSNPNISRQDLIAGYREAVDIIDDMFVSGSLKGKLTHSDIIRMMEQGAISDHGARAMYRYLKRKMHALPDNVKNYLSSQAAEVVDAQILYDDFEDALEDLFQMAGAMRTSDGQLLLNPENLQIIANTEFGAKVAELTKTANMLSRSGYETAAKVMRGMGDKTVRAATTEGFVNPRLFMLGGPAVKDIQIQKDMAKWMHNLMHNANTIYTPGGVGALKHAVNDVLRWWRGMATIARPSFHIRNLVGGVWNNMIVGVGPEDYAMVRTHAMAIRKALKAGDDLHTAIGKLPKKVQPYFEAAWQENVLSGFATTEFRKLLTDEQRTRWAWAKVWDIDDFALTRYGGKFMESIEDFLRMSAFVRWYDPADPATARVAREMTEAVHFNYTNLTPFETSVKQIVPFFVWQRRNLPLQISQLIENPRMIQRYNHMMSALSENLNDPGQENLPLGDNFTAFAAGTKYHVNANTPFWARVVIDPDLPVRDLVDLPMPGVQGLAEFANNMAGPHITSLFDINAEREFGNVNAPAPFNAILKSLAAIGLYDEDTEGNVRIPYYQRTVMETAFPFTREAFDPITGGPSDPNRRSRQGISPEDNAFEASAKSLMSTLARGLGFKFSTPADIRGSAARQREELNQIVQELRISGQLPPSQG